MADPFAYANQAGVLGGAAEKMPEVSAVERQHKAINDALDLISAVERVANRLVGTVPSAACASQGIQADGGILGELAERADLLRSRASDGYSALRRIERALPPDADRAVQGAILGRIG